MPAGKLARLLGHLGLDLTPGGVIQAVARAARGCQPTYQALIAGVGASPVVASDETGWRVGGVRAWLWAFAGAQVTLYRIAGGRGSQDAAAVLGEARAACWRVTAGRRTAASRTRPTRAAWRTCCGGCRELLADADRGQAKPRHAVRPILEHALALGAARDAGTLDGATLAAAAERLGVKLDKLIAGATRYPPNRRLLDHLGRERGHLVTFRHAPGVEPPTGVLSRPSAPRS